MLPSSTQAVQCSPVEPMTASPQTVFRQRFCNALDCRTLFFICTNCDRGQRYCSLMAGGFVGRNNAAPLVADTRRAWKVGSTIAIVNAHTGCARQQLAHTPWRAPIW